VGSQVEEEENGTFLPRKQKPHHRRGTGKKVAAYSEWVNVRREDENRGVWQGSGPISTTRGIAHRQAFSEQERGVEKKSGPAKGEPPLPNGKKKIAGAAQLAQSWEKKQKEVLGYERGGWPRRGPAYLEGEL